MKIFFIFINFSPTQNKRETKKVYPFIDGKRKYLDMQLKKIKYINEKKYFRNENLHYL